MKEDLLEEALENLAISSVYAGIFMAVFIWGTNKIVDWQMTKIKFHYEITTKSLTESKTWGELFERWEQDRETTLKKFEGKWWYAKCDFEKYRERQQKGK